MMRLELIVALLSVSGKNIEVTNESYNAKLIVVGRALREVQRKFQKLAVHS